MRSMQLWHIIIIFIFFFLKNASKDEFAFNL